MLRAIFVLLFLAFSATRCFSFDNVLLVTIDTLRADYVGYSGSNKVKTPNIDSLAARGIAFRDTVSSAPFTLPSHVTIFTGMIPPVHGVQDNGGFYLDKKIPTITEVFKGKGYKTAAFVGAFPVDSRFGLSKAFDVYDDSYPKVRNNPGVSWPERKADAVADAALQWLAAQGAGGHWFVWVHFFDPHFPYDPPDRFRSAYPDDPYAGEVAYADEQLGRILAFLKTSGAESKTLVVLTADHGESLGEHKEKTHGIFAYESTLRVPLVIAPLPHAVVTNRVRLVDVAPTILALQNLALPGKIQGNSLVPYFKTGSYPAQDSYFETLSMNLKSGWAPLRGFYSGSFQYINLPIPELYDLSKDPKEQTNLCSNASLCKEWAGRFGAFSKPYEKPPAPRAPVDRETVEQLRALGYMTGSPAPSTGKDYGPNDDPKNLIEFHNRVNEAMNKFNAGDSEEALQMLDEVIRQRPDYTQAYLYESFIHDSKGSPLEATEVLKKAVEKGIVDAELQGKLGFFLFRAGKFPEAIEALKKANEMDPLNLDNLNYLGMAYTVTGNAAEAQNAFDKAHAIDPSDGVTLSNMGSLHLSQKKYDVAITEFKQALEDNPSSVETYHGLASAYAAQSDWNNAIKYWSVAHDKAPKNMEYTLQLGMAYLRVEDAEKALPLLHDFVDHASPARYGKVLPKIRQVIQELEQ